MSKNFLGFFTVQEKTKTIHLRNTNLKQLEKYVKSGNNKAFHAIQRLYSLIKQGYTIA